MEAQHFSHWQRVAGCRGNTDGDQGAQACREPGQVAGKLGGQECDWREVAGSVGRFVLAKA